MFLYFFYFLVHYLHLQFSRWDKKLVSQKNYNSSEFCYELNGIKKNATIYRKRKDSKKVIMFLSGAYNLGFHAYIQKVMFDVESHCSSLASEYNLICYEKYDQSSIIIYDDVAYYIGQLDQELGGIEELILMGFSSGGVIASHIMQRLKGHSFRKKIITYDTPWQVQDNVESFANNIFYRPDYIFYQMVYHTYRTHYNYEDIKDCLRVNDGKRFKGAHELVAIIKHAHNYTDAEMRAVTGWNFDQTPDTVVYNIHTLTDPFVDRNSHETFVENNRDKIKFKVLSLSKKICGHTCDMAFSIKYLDDLVFAITDC